MGLGFGVLYFFCDELGCRWVVVDCVDYFGCYCWDLFFDMDGVVVRRVICFG